MRTYPAPTGYAPGGVTYGPRRPRHAPPAPHRRPGQTIDQWAREQAMRYINAQVASINQQRQIYLDELHKQSELEAQRGMALANALQGMNFGGKIHDIYGSAASDMAGLAGGFSSGIKDQANSQAAEMANMLSGTGQESGVRNAGVGMADVNYGQQGYIPGRSMVESGAAFGSEAALQPAFAAEQGRLDASRMLNEGLNSDAMSQFTQALVDARGQLPKLADDFKSQRLDAQQQAWKQQFDMLKFQSDQAYKNYLIEAQRGNTARANAYLKLAQQKAQAANMAAQGRQPNGKPLPGYRYDPKSGGYAKPNKPSTSPNVPGTAAFKQRQIQNVGKEQDNIEADVDRYMQSIKATDRVPVGGSTKGYASLKRQLLHKYEYLATTPAARQALIRAIDQAIRRWTPKPDKKKGSGGSGKSGDTVDGLLNG